MERRVSVRHDLRVRCRIGSGGDEALTENISRTGIMVWWCRSTPLPRIGEAVTLDVELVKRPGLPTRVLRCRTTVVRLIPGSGERHKVALQVHNIRFAAAKKPATICNLATISIPSEWVM